MSTCVNRRISTFATDPTKKTDWCSTFWSPRASSSRCRNTTTGKTFIFNINKLSINQVISFSFLAHTDPRDVARVESKTFISTPSQREAVPIPKPGVKGQLGNWMSPDDLEVAIRKRFPGCMKGRTLYLLAYRYTTTCPLWNCTF